MAKTRLVRFGERAQLIQADFRGTEWLSGLPVPMDAAVSATALHWLSTDQLANLYGQLAQILRPGGIFLNADHVRSDSATIQQAWERRREEMLCAEGPADGDDWDGFWDAYAQALGMDIAAIHKRLLGEWRGEELPLAWHLDHLRASGFTAVDCFWRCDCDAIYGGIRL